MNDHPSTSDLIDYLHHELEPGVDARIHAHLGGCASCRADIDAETRIAEALRFAAAEGERELPGQVRAAIWQAFDAQRPSVGERVRAFLRPVVLIPTAAGVAAVALFVAPLTHGAGAGPQIDAAYYLEAHAVQQAQNPFAEHATSAMMEASLTGPDARSAPVTLADDDTAPGALAHPSGLTLADGLGIVR